MTQTCASVFHQIPAFPPARVGSPTLFLPLWDLTLPFSFSAVSPLQSIIHIAMWINSTQCIPGDPLLLSLSLETSLYLCPFLTSPPSSVKSSLQTTSKPLPEDLHPKFTPRVNAYFPLTHTSPGRAHCVALSMKTSDQRWGHQGGYGTLSGLPCSQREDEPLTPLPCWPPHPARRGTHRGP